MSWAATDGSKTGDDRIDDRRLVNGLDRRWMMVKLAADPIVARDLNTMNRLVKKVRADGVSSFVHSGQRAEQGRRKWIIARRWGVKRCVKQSGVEPMSHQREKWTRVIWHRSAPFPFLRHRTMAYLSPHSHAPPNGWEDSGPNVRIIVAEGISHQRRTRS
jgi:hypothetical protein